MSQQQARHRRNEKSERPTRHMVFSRFAGAAYLPVKTVYFQTACYRSHLTILEFVEQETAISLLFVLHIGIWLCGVFTTNQIVCSDNKVIGTVWTEFKTAGGFLKE